MPQMFPLPWMSMYLIFILLIVMLALIVYFMKTPISYNKYPINKLFYKW
nr:ATP synthase F0 subunit 8 [Peloridium hammoniorum]